MQTSILTEQLRRSGVLVRHDYEADTLDMIPVSSVMTPDAVTVSQEMTVAELVDKINQHDPRLTRHQALLLVDKHKRAVGHCHNAADLLKAVNGGHSDLTLLEAGSTDMWVAFPLETLCVTP